jgi:rubrerythrin
VKTYGTLQKIAGLISKYGSFEKYDVAMKRTGVKDNPWEIINASRLKDKDMLEDLINDDGSQVAVDKIVVGPLTQEELSYEQYNIDRFFCPTSYHKIQSRIGGVFKLCDAQLGTHFTEELEGLVQKEQAEWDARAAEKEAAQSETENSAIKEAVSVQEADPVDEAMAAPAPEAPARRRATADEGLSAEKIALLKGWEHLSDEIKARIKDVTDEGGKVSIVWDRKDDLLQCDACGALSPEEGVTHCPVCGAKF